MNKKILAGIAGVGLAAAAVGGGTFASWSDFATYSNSAGAEHLTLDASANSGTIGFSQENMAPGHNREFDFVVASRGGNVVPDATLTLQMLNLVGTEDAGSAPGGCTSNSEAAEDTDGCTDDGEFIDEAMIAINASNPTTGSNPCGDPRGGRVSLRPLKDVLTAGSGGVVNLLPAGVTLKPGEKICVGMGLSLPYTSATNKSQGDGATWDFKYTLTQVPGAGTVTP
jgi:predicted ribosomally synthesized peptide with SipW-like signal peptide